MGLGEAEEPIMEINLWIEVKKEERSAKSVRKLTLRIWRCLKHRDLPTEEKWKVAKKLGLCYCCLGNNHQEVLVNGTRKCNTDGCNKNHNHLLHRPKLSPPEEPPTGKKEQTGSTTKEAGAKPSTKGDSEGKTYGATTEQGTKLVALRTVPVVAKNGNKKLHVN